MSTEQVFKFESPQDNRSDWIVFNFFVFICVRLSEEQEKLHTILKMILYSSTISKGLNIIVVILLMSKLKGTPFKRESMLENEKYL